MGDESVYRHHAERNDRSYRYVQVRLWCESSVKEWTVTLAGLKGNRVACLPSALVVALPPLL